jgi:hypothetical protein
VDWLSVDGSPVLDVHGVRRVLLNGTLILLPFPPAAYRQDIHSTVYRCVASNAVGRIVSRDVQVRAGNSSVSSAQFFFWRNSEAYGGKGKSDKLFELLRVLYKWSSDFGNVMGHQIGMIHHFS